MDQMNRNVDTVMQEFQEITRKPDHFVNADDSLLNKIKTALKSTYDYTKSSEEKLTNKSGALRSLLIKNFDLEQIWQQIELQNESLLSQSIQDVSKLLVGKNQLIFNHLKSEIENLRKESDDSEEIFDNNIIDTAAMNNSGESGSESDDEVLELNKDDESNYEDKSEEEKLEDNFRNSSKKNSVIDDEFFKVDEMNKFLNAEEKKMQNNPVDIESNNSDDESDHSVDYFKEDLNDKDEDDNVKTAKFKDFFVAKNDNTKTKRNKFLDGVVSDNESNNEDNEMKSSLQLRQDRLQKKIRELEQDAISEKPWQLKGEIRAEDRPQNSLLEEIVDFDLTSRPAPIITEKTTLQLEDIIKQRIKDKVFDSVERKIKPVETPLEYKKKLVLDQEKSKHSLAQIYEKEFMEQQAALDPENAEKKEEEPELHKEIKILMKNLFSKLDALSNFHFTPKPAIPEMKVVSNLSAITIEEVAPTAESNAALLAPEEVKNKTKGEIIAKSERTDTDKKRERRKKKIKQRMHLKEKEKRANVVNKLKSGMGNKHTKEKTKKMLEKVSKESNTEKMDEKMGSKAVKSSKAFFTQLQEEVQSQIQGKIKRDKLKERKDTIDVKKLKL